MTPIPMPMRVVVIATCMCVALESATIASSKRMADGKEWTTDNLNVEAPGSVCYDDAPQHCARYGRLYTWAAAQTVCPSLGAGWRLPSVDDWRQLAQHHGGLREEAKDLGKAAFTALMTGGSSGFNAELGGNREADGSRFGRLDAHGFYWTASETDPGHAWMYNFGRNGQSLNRHRGGDKRMAVSVRCLKD